MSFYGNNSLLIRSKNTEPVFAPVGYTRLWGVSSNTTGTISGTVLSNTGKYAVKWSDNTVDVYDSGDPFSKPAAGNQRAFEIYPCVTKETSLLLNFDGSVSDESPNPNNIGDGFASSTTFAGVVLTRSQGGYTPFVNGDATLYYSYADNCWAFSDGQGYPTLLGETAPLNDPVYSGGPTISTSIKKFGSGSAYFDGSTYLEVPGGSRFSLDQLAWTIDFWVRFSSVGVNQTLLAISDPVTSNRFFLNLRATSYSGSPINSLYFYSTGGELSAFPGSDPMAADQWYHVAITCNLGTLKMFVDGVKIAENLDVTGTGGIYNSASLMIGCREDFTSKLTGYIDGLRIVKGEVTFQEGDSPPAAAPSVVLSGLAPLGQFDGFDVSDNSLTQLRAEDVSLSSTAGYYQYGGWQNRWQTSYGGWFGGTWVPGPYVPGPFESGDLSENNLSTAALDQFYTDLDSDTGSLFVQGNPGIDGDDPTIATAKGYTVFGSEPRTAYFSGTDLGGVNNYWADLATSVPFGEVPSSTDSVVLLSSPTAGSEYFGSLDTSNGYSIEGGVAIQLRYPSTVTTYSNGTLIGTITFDGGYNNGTVIGDANFINNAANTGSVSGTATFDATSCNSNGTAGSFVPNPPPSCQE